MDGSDNTRRTILICVLLGAVTMALYWPVTDHDFITLAQRACKLASWHQAVFIGTLAAAYAEAGQFEKALETAQKACDLATSLGQTNLLQRNQKLMRLYREGRPVRE